MLFTIRPTLEQKTWIQHTRQVAESQGRFWGVGGWLGLVLFTLCAVSELFSCYPCIQSYDIRGIIFSDPILSWVALDISCFIALRVVCQQKSIRREPFPAAPDLLHSFAVESPIFKLFKEKVGFFKI